MSSLRRSGVALVCIVTTSTAWAGTPLEVASGAVTLPLTGLSVDLPKDKREGAVWSLTGSWSFSDGGASFDARDVVDLKVGGKLVAGTWVHVGYFNAGDCGAVVNELDVPDRWTAERDLWGRHWFLSGGTWDFENDLGKVPTIALCTPRPNRASLLLYYFFIDQKIVEPMIPVPREANLVALGKNPLLERLAKAWEKDQTAAVIPLQRPELTRRGDIAAVRTVHLAKSGMDVTLPDDGYPWLARAPAAEDVADYLDRMAPAAPDVSLEIARIAGVPCDQIFAPSGPDAPPRKQEPPPKNIPPGWKSLGTLVVGDPLERVVCRETGGKTLVVGVVVTPAEAGEGTDMAPYTPILTAIAAGSDASPIP